MRIHYHPIAAMLLLCGAAFAGPPIRVFTVDGQIHEGALADMRRGVLVVEREGERLSLPIGTVQRIVFAEAPALGEPDEERVEAFISELLALAPTEMLKRVQAAEERGEATLLRLAAERLRGQQARESHTPAERRARWLAQAALSAAGEGRRRGEELLRRIGTRYEGDPEVKAFLEEIRALWRRTEERPRRGR